MGCLDGYHSQSMKPPFFPSYHSRCQRSWTSQASRLHEDNQRIHTYSDTYLTAVIYQQIKSKTMASVLRRHWQAFTASAQPFASEALEQANIIAMSLLPALLHFLEHLPAYCVFAAVAHFILKSMANMICRLLLNLVRCLTALSWAILALSEYIVGSEC